MDNTQGIYTADITVGYACNQNCLFCSIAHMRKDIIKTTAQIKESIEDAKKHGASVLGFGGGEPTIRRDIFEIVEFTRQLEFPVIRIQTNGMMFSYDDFTERIIASGANFFKFSIHGHNSRIHDSLTQVSGSFDNALKGLDNIRKRGYSAEIDIVINRLNYKYLPQFVDFFISIGISKFCFIYMVYEGNLKKYHEKIAVKISDIIPYVDEAFNIIAAYQIDKSVLFNIPFCFYNKHSSHMAEMNDFNTMVFTPANVQFLDDNKRNNKIKCDACTACIYSQKCSGLWKTYCDIFGTDEIIPVREK